VKVKDPNACLNVCGIMGPNFRPTEGESYPNRTRGQGILPNNGIADSNPTRGIDICVCSVSVLPRVGSDLETG
jgi:hypothetical protein